MFRVFFALALLCWRFWLFFFLLFSPLLLLYFFFSLPHVEEIFAPVQQAAWVCFRFKLAQQKRVCEVVWLCDGPHLHWNHIIGYIWPPEGSGAVERLCPQDALKGLYIVATIDTRFYSRLYKYVNACYLIGAALATHLYLKGSGAVRTTRKTVVCILSEAEK